MHTCTQTLTNHFSTLIHNVYLFLVSHVAKLMTKLIVLENIVLGFLFSVIRKQIPIVIDCSRHCFLVPASNLLTSS